MWWCTPAPASVQRPAFRTFGECLHRTKCDTKCVCVLFSNPIVPRVRSGPNGVWTLEEKGEKPTINVSFDAAAPTKTHMALKALVDGGQVAYIVSQNIDGLHLKSGLARRHISELHGNMFVENCSKCRRQYVRSTPAPTVGQKPTGGLCKGGSNQRACRGGQLLDNILDWEHDLPDKDMDLAYSHSCLADLNICLGSTLQINPSGQLAIKNKKYGGKLVICNLQPTKYDKKADVVINGYVDVVMEKVMKRLGVEIPEYTGDDDPTKDTAALALEWTIPGEQVKETEKLYNAKVKGTKKRKPFLLDWDTPPKKVAVAKREPKKEAKPKLAAVAVAATTATAATTDGDGDGGGEETVKTETKLEPAVNA